MQKSYFLFMTNAILLCIYSTTLLFLYNTQGEVHSNCMVSDNIYYFLIHPYLANKKFQILSFIVRRNLGWIYYSIHIFQSLNYIKLILLNIIGS